MHIAYMNCGNYWLDVKRIQTFRRTAEVAGSHYYKIPCYQCFPKHFQHPARYAQQAHE